MSPETAINLLVIGGGVWTLALGALALSWRNAMRHERPVLELDLPGHTRVGLDPREVA